MNNVAKDIVSEGDALSPLKIVESILQEMGIQTWIKDAEGRYTYVNQQMLIADNIADMDIIGKTDAEIYEEERARIFTDFDKETIKNSVRTIASYELPNGTFEEVHKQPVFDENGNLLGIYGYAKDITVEKLLEEHTRLLVKEENRFRRIFQNAPIGIAIFNNSDTSGKPLLVNGKWCQLLGRTEADILNSPWNDFLANQEDYLDGRDNLDKLEDGTISSFSIERKFIKGDGTEVWLNITIAGYEIEQDGNHHNVCMAEDITKRKQIEQEIKRISYTDVLTQLYNRNYLLHNMQRLNEYDIRPFSVIIGDGNGLKICNDAFGHAEGDKMIQALAEAFRENIPEANGAFVARIGGDEFCAILPGVSEAEVNKISEDIKKSLEGKSEKFFEYTVSLGTCTVNTGEVNIDDMLNLAESKMYAEKTSSNRHIGDRIIDILIDNIRNDSLEKSHIENVTRYCGLLADVIGYSEEKKELLCSAARLHDIGMATDEKRRKKTGVPLFEQDDKISSKQYREASYRLIKSTIKYSRLAPIILNYNEAMELIEKGETPLIKEINLSSRILCVTDYYDSQTNPVFGIGKEKAEVISDLQSKANKYFDGYIVDVFINKILCKE